MPKMSESINELAAALVKVQSQLPAVPKSKTVQVATKSGSKFSYSYAPLDAVWDGCRNLLSENGLALTQTMCHNDSCPCLETVLLHTSGQWISSTLPLVATQDPQQLGSAITYMRRYALAALVGIVADEDDDAQAGRPQRQDQHPSKESNGRQKDGALSPKARFLRKAQELQGKIPEENFRAILREFDWASPEDVADDDLETMKKFVQDLQAEADVVAAGF